MTSTKFGNRFECASSSLVSCDRGSGVPKRSTCSACGSRLQVFSGLFGVFVWDASGVYHLNDAVSLHSYEKVAEKACEKDSRLVVRWCPLDS